MLLLGDFALLLVAGCATAHSAPPASVPVESPVEATTVAGTRVAVDVLAPPLVRVAEVRPPQDPLATQGSAVFFRVCGPCHQGMWRVPSGGTLSATERTEAAVLRQIREGSGGGSAGMPAIGTDALPVHDMPALLAYLRTLRVVAPR